MAGKITAPQPAIYQSDPIEQVYGKAALDPQWGGIGAMYLNAAEMRRDRGMAAYEEGVREANRMAVILQQMEEQGKMRQEVLKHVATLATKGYAPNTMPMASMLFDDRNAPTVQDPAALFRELERAKIAENYAKAAAAGGDTYTISSHVSPQGAGETKVQVKGRTYQQANDRFTQATIDELIRRGLAPTDANTPFKIKSPADARAAAEAAARARNQNIN
jgi:hypothetical protein